MVGQSLLAWLSQRLKEATIKPGDENIHSFGKIPVVNLFGDVMQLGSFIGETDLHRVPLSSANAICRAGFIDYITIETVIVLDEIMRQKPSQVALRRRLENIRNGTISQKDCKEIKDRHIDNLPNHEKANFNTNPNAIWLCETWADVNKHNFKEMSNFEAVATLTSSGKGIHHVRKPRMGQVPHRCIVASGCRVMLTKNQGALTQYGLNNGAIGTVKSILYKEGKSPRNNEFPEVIMVEFPKYNGPAFNSDFPKWVPIPPIVTICDTFCCKRTGFPLTPAYAITINKSQGMTIGAGQQCTHAVIQLQDHINMECHSPGLAYTAFSRVSEDTDWCLANDIPA